MSQPSESNPNPNPTRREFVRTTGAIAGSVTGVLALGLPKVHAAEESIIRVGLVGCGGRGTGAAVNAMKADPTVRIVALADLYDTSIQNCRKSLGKRFEDQFQVTNETCFVGFDAYEKLMAADVDVVLLATPPCYRPEHIEAAVDAGKEIFCEKPIATDPAGVRRVRAACKKADEKGLNIVSGLCWRYDQGMQETITRIHDGQIGTVVSSQFDYLANPVWTKVRKDDESDLMYQCRNWYNFAWASGDHIVEQFIHSLDKAMWLHHDVPPVRAYGIGGRQNRSDGIGGNIYDHFAVVYEWADGSRTHANTRQMKGCFNQTEDFVYGTDGTAKMCKHVIEGAQPWKFAEKKVQMHQAEQNEFFQAIRGQRDRINNGDYMCNSTLMAIMGREVCYGGKDLTFDQVAASPQQMTPVDYANAEAPPVVVPTPGDYKFPLAV